MHKIHTRIAPTPSGYLHLGNAFSFLYTYLLFQSGNTSESSLRLRIDDADATRCRDEYLEDIFFSLDWLGITFTKGPSSVDDFKKNFSQQLRFDLYQEYTEQLKQLPNLVYACNCSRSQIKKASTNGLYPNTCRHRNLSFDLAQIAWRIQVPQASIKFADVYSGQKEIFLAQQMGDFVLKRKDGLPAYQLASVVDDLYYEINFIVRGNDLLDSTAAQVFLGQQLKATAFDQIQFCHHPLILEQQNQKLSKSHQSLSLKEMRLQWPNPAFIYQAFAKLIGLPSKIDTLEALSSHFNPTLHQIPHNYYLKDLLDY